jgi:hypothetical protein
MPLMPDSLDVGIVKSKPAAKYPEERNVMTLIFLGITSVRNHGHQLIRVMISYLESALSYVKHD